MGDGSERGCGLDREGEGGKSGCQVLVRVCILGKEDRVVVLVREEVEGTGGREGRIHLGLGLV